MTTVVNRDETEVMAEINITPFTDVLLVLLIIFMILAALILPPGFEKQLPNRCEPRCTSPAHVQPRSIDVVINAKGAIFVDGRSSDVRRVYADLASVAKRHGAHTHLSLIGDLRAPYAVVMRILDAAQRAGLDDVGFVTS